MERNDLMPNIKEVVVEDLKDGFYDIIKLRKGCGVSFVDGHIDEPIEQTDSKVENS